uniref:Uncharacterized protein n=1 Tax=Arundo donax TaxID=35708 RepID=A0A0A9DH34_ARUDO
MVMRRREMELEREAEQERKVAEGRHICVSLCTLVGLQSSPPPPHAELQRNHWYEMQWIMVGLNGVVKEWSGLLPRCSPHCQVLFIFMRPNFVCFWVFFCILLMLLKREKGGGSMLCWEAHACVP